jgi:hypothetical protein
LISVSHARVSWEMREYEHEKTPRSVAIGDRVAMPEPSKDDAWEFGDFVARVIAISPGGDLLVEDQDSDVWEVAGNRVELVPD